MNQKEKYKRIVDQFHSKNIFGIWLLVILFIFFSLFLFILKLNPLMIPFAFFLLFAFLATGAYTFQEIRTLHNRIDALRKLMENE